MMLFTSNAISSANGLVLDQKLWRLNVAIFLNLSENLLHQARSDVQVYFGGDTSVLSVLSDYFHSSECSVGQAYRPC